MKKQWWHNKVAYQIYPKSFCDSNGDGIGDLRGIISKLDYLKELGVDIVWISPVYCSPFVDQGYDISDYYNIDPLFGNMDDMDELLAEAKKRNISVLMDLVVNHCSDQHEWFKKAMADPDGPYGEYFYIREGKENGEPPCNWRSYFGGSAWEKVPGTENKYYLHMFAKEQPDLNWENPKVREEIYKMINWWLDRGLGGFRIDAIINIKKDLTFSDYPADREDGLCAGYKMLEHAVGVTDFLDEMNRETFAKHDAFSIAELFNYRPEELEKYIGDEGCFSSIFDFSTELLGGGEKGWYDLQGISPKLYRNTIFASQKQTEGIGYLANIIENHDEPRGVCRYLPEEGRTVEGKKMLGMLMFMKKGLPFIYQGQELGMENNKFKDISEIDDLNTIDEYHVALEAGCSKEQALAAVNYRSRDNARTPFHWDATEKAGFTTGTPWLVINENHKEINAADQVGRADSVFSFYQELIRLRKNPEYEDVVVYGKLEPVFESLDNVFAFYRVTDEKKLLVLANYQTEPVTLTLNEVPKNILINNYADVEWNGKDITLKGFQGVVIDC